MSVIAMAAAWSADGRKRLTPEGPAFSADSTLVLVPVTVMDRRGAIVNGLASDVFTVTEDGVRQQIRSFSEEDAPVSMGVVLDLSGSMKRVLGAAKESLRTLIQDANPGDEAFLNAVSTRPRPYTGFTENLSDILGRVAFEDARGQTALIDTVYDSLKELRTGIHARKALLIISDGVDNHSRYTKRDLLELALETDAQIYTIAVGRPPASYAKPMAMMEETRGLLFLDELATPTGGFSYVVHSQADIATAAASIGQALRNQYTIGYAPRVDGQSGKWRSIRVRVAGGGRRAYARTGYRTD